MWFWKNMKLFALQFEIFHIIEYHINIILKMYSYPQTPIQHSGYSSKKVFSPTTAQSRTRNHVKSSSTLFDSIKNEINDIIAEASTKHS